MATTGLSAATPRAAPAPAPAHQARSHGQNVAVAAVGRGSSLATVAAKLVLLCAVGTGLVGGGPLGVNGQTLLTTTTSATSGAVATAVPLDIATPISTTTTADHTQHGSSHSSHSASVSVSGSDVITSVAKPAAEPTTASVWVPGYMSHDWNDLRGSIISSVGFPFCPFTVRIHGMHVFRTVFALFLRFPNGRPMMLRIPTTS